LSDILNGKSELMDEFEYKKNAGISERITEFWLESELALT